MQYLTIDYGLEFCDYYGARCNKHSIESMRVSREDGISPTVKMTWMPFRLPLRTVPDADPAAATTS